MEAKQAGFRAQACITVVYYQKKILTWSSGFLKATSALKMGDIAHSQGQTVRLFDFHKTISSNIRQAGF